MSRIGQSPIKCPDNVKINKKDNSLSASGPKGELEVLVSKNIEIEINEGLIKLANKDDTKKGKANWGTTRALINNMVKGVSEGFTKKMEIVGVGYRGALNGKILSLNLGLSHTVEMPIPEGIEVKMDGNTKFMISGADKQKVGQFASIVRSKRPPEPFKGKGLRYENEYIVRKEGKKK